MPTFVRGSNLPASLQREAKARFVHRYTRDHKPGWAQHMRPNGRPYPVQFASDADWLDNTHFSVNDDWRLTKNAPCESRPTWPDGEE